MRPANDNARTVDLRIAGMTRGQSVFALISAALALLAVVSGLLAIDPPWVARQLRLDDQRSNALNRIFYAVGQFYKVNDKLPASLSQLNESPSGLDARSESDPVTTAPYHYEAGAGREFKLCATFSMPSKNSIPVVPFWRHEAGQQCFNVTAQYP